MTPTTKAANAKRIDFLILKKRQELVALLTSLRVSFLALPPANYW
jgi:hypothetical protein